MGMKFANFHARLAPRVKKTSAWRPIGKMNGGTGNYNAHHFARPDVDWPALARKFVERQGLRFAPLTTQIPPYDDLATWFNLLRSLDNILMDFCQDMQGHITRDYFCLPATESVLAAGARAGKINPLNYENIEDSLGLANAYFAHFADKLPVARWQRDLSDSTVTRNIGVALGHALLAGQERKAV